MAQYIRRFAAPLALSLALATAACGEKDDTAATDTSLNRDLALAGDTAGQPQLTDVPAPTATTAPSTSAPAAAAPAPAPSTATRSTPARSTGTRTTTTTRSSSGTNVTRSTSGGGTAPAARGVSAGTQLTFANAGESVCTNTKNAGDTFTMQLEGSAGGVSSGSATFRVTESRGARNANERPTLTLALVSMTLDGRTRSPSASVDANVDVTVENAGSTTAKNVGGGAAIGAVAGRVLGGNRGTAVGAAVGAAAGAARAAQTADRKGCLRNAVVTLNESFAL